MTQTATARVLSDVLERRAQDDPDGVAFDVDGGAQLRFADWADRSRAVAHALRDAGVGRGHRVGLWFSGLDWIDYAVAYLGALRAGGTCVHLNDGLPGPEVHRRLAECQVSWVVHADRLSPPTGFAGPSATVSTLERERPGRLDVEVAPADIADILYTSGTTGAAKAYTVPHGNLTFGRKVEVFASFRDCPTTYLLVPMRLGSGTSATCVSSALSAQQTSLVCLPDDVERMGQLIERHRVASIAVTPWIAIQMRVARLHERHDLSSVGMVFCGSAALPPAIAVAMSTMMPAARVASACSQSEAGPALLVNMFDPARPFSVGQPTPGTELRIVDEHGDPVPTGALGEIWLRHPAPRKLYLDPALRRLTEADGWYRTGDYGRLDPAGGVHFFDRGADLIRRDGELVSSLEVEAALYEHEAVREVAVFAAPGTEAQPEIQAAVVLADPAQLPDVERFAARRLAAAQLPVRFVAVDGLPRGQTGKVLKRELRSRVVTEAVGGGR